MDVVNLDEGPPFVAKDGSTIRPLLDRSGSSWEGGGAGEQALLPKKGFLPRQSPDSRPHSSAVLK